VYQLQTGRRGVQRKFFGTGSEGCRVRSGGKGVQSRELHRWKRWCWELRGQERQSENGKKEGVWRVARKKRSGKRRRGLGRRAEGEVGVGEDDWGVLRDSGSGEQSRVCGGVVESRGCGKKERRRI
jgi:hypothetical protein